MSALPSFYLSGRNVEVCEAAVAGVAHTRVIGEAPKIKNAVETAGAEPRGAVQAAATGEPLSGLQWDMKQIHATADGSYRVERGDRRVLVGIIDTGVDGNH